MVGEEDEGLGEAEAGRQAVLQGEVLLAHRRAARRVLRTERSCCRVHRDGDVACFTTVSLTSTLTLMVCSPVR